MAQVLSGSFDTNGYDGKHLNFSWTGTQSISGNYTDVAWTLKGAGGSGYHMAGDFTVIIDGETVYSSATRIELWNGTVVASGTKRINHNANGNRSFSASVSASIYTFAVDKTGSGSWELPTIPRYTSISSFTVSKRNETSFTFNWQTADTIDYLYYSTDNGSNWTGLDVTDGTSGNFTVSGLSPNTTYNCKIRVRRKDSQLTTDSSTVSQTTYKAPSQSLASKTETSITMNWSCDSTANYIWYSKDGGTNWTAVGSVNATSGSYTISGLTANTSYSIKTRVRRSATSTTYDTSASSQKTYQYPYVDTVETSNLTIGGSQKLTLYNPLGRSCTVYMKKDSTSGTQLYSGTTTGTSITFTPTANTLYASIPSSQSGNCVYYCTYSNQTVSTKSGTYKVTGNEKPTFTNFTYKDSNSSVVNVTGNNQVMVKGLSTVQVTISSSNKMVANNSATANKYNMAMSTLNTDVNYSSSQIVTELGTINDSGTQRLTVTAYDSRLLDKAVYKDITVYDYAKPVISASILRLNSFENQTTLKVTGTYTKLTINNTNKNTITNVKYRYREAGGTWGSWTNLTTTVNNGAFTCSDVVLSLDNSKVFEFEIQATDNLQTNTASASVDIGIPILLISSNTKKVGINRFPTGTADLQVNGDIDAGGITGSTTIKDGNTSLRTLKELNTQVSTNVTNISGKAPKSHASTANTYGLGTTANYGHVKTINGLTQSAYADGEALSAYQGKVLKDDVDGKAPKSHASSATTYGVGTASNYGHCKVINNLTTSSASNGNALNAYQGKVLKGYVDDVTETVLWTGTKKISSNNTGSLTLSGMPNLSNYAGKKLRLYVSFNEDMPMIKEFYIESVDKIAFFDITRDYSGNGDVWTTLFAVSNMNSTSWAVKTHLSYLITWTSISNLNAGSFNFYIKKVAIVNK